MYLASAMWLAVSIFALFVLMNSWTGVSAYTPEPDFHFTLKHFFFSSFTEAAFSCHFLMVRIDSFLLFLDVKVAYVRCPALPIHKSSSSFIISNTQ